MSEPSSKILDFTKAIALEAGEMLMTYAARGSFEIRLKGEKDLVTEVDLAVEKMLVEKIKSTYPNHRILSEESFSTLDSRDWLEPLWVIDPIDGTTNFAHGHPCVAISIAFVEGGLTRVGVVNAPFLRELYWASQGCGAFCNDRKLRCNDKKDIAQALVATGFPASRGDLTAKLGQKVAKLVASVHDLRCDGSAAIHCCFVAHGRIDAYFEDIKPWDIAAGSLIAREAGATARADRNTPSIPQEISSLGFLVSTPSLFDEMVALLID